MALIAAQTVGLTLHQPFPETFHIYQLTSLLFPAMPKPGSRNKPNNI
jgi:hypothetical protein